MSSPLIQVQWILAVLLGLYGFYCHWEASRAELAAAFRRRSSRSDALRPEATRYRARSRLALLGGSLLAAGAIVSAV